jgi:hypothetical protein
MPTPSIFSDAATPGGDDGSGGAARGDDVGGGNTLERPDNDNDDGPNDDGADPAWLRQVVLEDDVSLDPIRFDLGKLSADEGDDDMDVGPIPGKPI